MSPPLSGVTVLDLTQIYNGPYATFLLAQAGAEVIKIEPPGGEHLRRRQGWSGAAMPFAMFNANKRSMTLNLKSEQGRDLLLRLVEKADVLVENFAPGVMERLGVGEAVLQPANPRLIYASSSGYGKTGPYRDYPAMDLTVQAMTGVIDSTGYPDGPPVKAGPAVADLLAGIHLFGAVTAALYARERSGKGESVEVSMMEAVYPTLASSLSLYYGSKGRSPTRTGNRHSGLSLCPYNVYPTSDGYLAIITNHDQHWGWLVQALGAAKLGADPRLQTINGRCEHMDLVDGAIAELTTRYTKAELFELLTRHRVPCAPVRTVAEVVEDPHLHARGSLQWIDHPEYGRIVVPSSPVRFPDDERVPYVPSAALGEHTQEVLHDKLGLGAGEVEALKAAGAL
jgi:formyl-CoA transferase